MFEFGGGAWSLVWGAKPLKAPPWRRDWHGHPNCLWNV